MDFLPESLCLEVAGYLWYHPDFYYPDDLKSIRGLVRLYKACVIQRWYRNRYRSACEDCGRSTTSLRETPACPDFQIRGNLCCTKYVCDDGCRWWCPNGHANFSYDEDGWRESARCGRCEVVGSVGFRWYGISLPEMKRREGLW